MSCDRVALLLNGRGFTAEQAEVWAGLKRQLQHLSELQAQYLHTKLENMHRLRRYLEGNALPTNLPAAEIEASIREAMTFRLLGGEVSLSALEDCCTRAFGAPCFTLYSDNPDASWVLGRVRKASVSGPNGPVDVVCIEDGEEISSPFLGATAVGSTRIRDGREAIIVRGQACRVAAERVWSPFARVSGMSWRVLLTLSHELAHRWSQLDKGDLGQKGRFLARRGKDTTNRNIAGWAAELCDFADDSHATPLALIRQLQTGDYCADIRLFADLAGVKLPEGGDLDTATEIFLICCSDQEGLALYHDEIRGVVVNHGQVYLDRLFRIGRALPEILATTYGRLESVDDENIERDAVRFFREELVRCA